MAKKMMTIDGNTAAAHVAYAFTDVAAIFPITIINNLKYYFNISFKIFKINIKFILFNNFLLILSFIILLFSVFFYK